MTGINTKGIIRDLTLDPDVNDLSDAPRILNQTQETTPDSNDLPLIEAWVTFDPNADNSEERASIILRNIRKPLKVNDPKGTLRSELCLRIRHTAFDPDREIKRLNLDAYDTIEPNSDDDPYKEYEYEDWDKPETPAYEMSEETKAKIRRTRETHREQQYGTQADTYNKLTGIDPDYWNMLKQGAGLSGDAPWASRYMMADIAWNMRGQGYDPREGVEYRKTAAFRKLEKQLLNGRKATRMYKRLRTLANNESEYTRLMNMIGDNQAIWADDAKYVKPVYGFGELGQTLVLRRLLERRGLDAVLAVVRGDGLSARSPYGLWRVEDIAF